jgi:hypothetical protein
MLTMCGFTTAVERARLLEYERFASLDAFGDYTDTMIESMADKNEKRTPANTRVRFGIQHVLYVKAVSFWVHKQRRKGVPVLIDNLNPDVIARMVQEMNLEHSMDASADEDKVGQPVPMRIKWANWQSLIPKSMCRGPGVSRIILTYCVASWACHCPTFFVPKMLTPPKLPMIISVFSGWHLSRDLPSVRIIIVSTISTRT